MIVFLIRYSIDIALLNKQGILDREARTISCCMNYPGSQQAKRSRREDALKVRQAYLQYSFIKYIKTRTA
uniref:Uncharacterized protein n=1 Tax=Picea glauca TaxID=3330 RepID=A0A101M5P2_PICGL|nr:hypothetical protein ABT39_MTgene1132 [Picea glauca]